MTTQGNVFVMFIYKKKELNKIIRSIRSIRYRIKIGQKVKTERPPT